MPRDINGTTVSESGSSGGGGGINDTGNGSTDLWSAEKIGQELASNSTVDQAYSDSFHDQTLNQTDNVQFAKLTTGLIESPASGASNIELKNSKAAVSLTYNSDDLFNEASISVPSNDMRITPIGVFIDAQNPGIILNSTNTAATAGSGILFQGNDTIGSSIGQLNGDVLLKNSIPNKTLKLQTGIMTMIMDEAASKTEFNHAVEAKQAYIGTSSITGTDALINSTTTQINSLTCQLQPTTLQIQPANPVQILREVQMNSQKISGLLDPAALQDAATKAYVDSQVGSITYNQSLNTTDDVQFASVTIDDAGSKESLILKDNDANGISAINKSITFRDQNNTLGAQLEMSLASMQLNNSAGGTLLLSAGVPSLKLDLDKVTTNVNFQSTGDNVHDLGTATNRWKDLHLSNEALVYNQATANFTTLKYTDTADREVDFKQFETVATSTQVIPPTMTSNTLVDSDGTWIASSGTVNPVAGFEQWRAFNGIAADDHFSTANTYTVAGIYNGGLTTDGYAGDWLQIQLPITTAISQYNLARRDSFTGRFEPLSWKLFNSTDGINWTELHGQVDYVWGANTNVAFTPTDTTTVGSYYRIVVSKVSAVIGTGGFCHIAELSLTASFDNCPSGCFHVLNKARVEGDIEAVGNAAIVGQVSAASADITGNLVVGSVLQDTAVDIYGSIAYTGADILLTGFVAGVPKEIVATPTSSVLSSTGLSITPPNTFALLLDTPGVYDISASCAISPDQDGDTISLVIFADATQIGTWSTRTLKMRDRFETVALSLIYQAAGSERITLRLINTNNDDVTVNSLALKIVRLRTNQ